MNYQQLAAELARIAADPQLSGNQKRQLSDAAYHQYQLANPTPQQPATPPPNAPQPPTAQQPNAPQNNPAPQPPTSPADALIAMFMEERRERQAAEALRKKRHRDDDDDDDDDDDYDRYYRRSRKQQKRADKAIVGYHAAMAQMQIEAYRLNGIYNPQQPQGWGAPQQPHGFMPPAPPVPYFNPLPYNQQPPSRWKQVGNDLLIGATRTVGGLAAGAVAGALMAPGHKGGGND